MFSSTQCLWGLSHYTCLGRLSTVRVPMHHKPRPKIKGSWASWGRNSETSRHSGVLVHSSLLSPLCVVNFVTPNEFHSRSSKQMFELFCMEMNTTWTEVLLNYWVTMPSAVIVIVSTAPLLWRQHCIITVTHFTAPSTWRQQCTVTVTTFLFNATVVALLSTINILQQHNLHHGDTTITQWFVISNQCYRLDLTWKYMYFTNDQQLTLYKITQQSVSQSFAS